MKKAWTIIVVICIIAGCIVGYFSKIAIVDYVAVAVMAFGFVTLIMKTIQKVEKKTWKEIIGIICFCVAGGCGAIAGMAQDTMTQLITLVAGLVVFIAGLITVNIKKE